MRCSSWSGPLSAMARRPTTETNAFSQDPPFIVHAAASTLPPSKKNSGRSPSDLGRLSCQNTSTGMLAGRRGTRGRAQNQPSSSKAVQIAAGTASGIARENEERTPASFIATATHQRPVTARKRRRCFFLKVSRAESGGTTLISREATRGIPSHLRPRTLHPRPAARDASPSPVTRVINRTA